MVHFLCILWKRFFMKNKNIPSQGNKQNHPHREGQQENLSGTRGTSNRDIQQTGKGRSERSETESERANRNEDKNIRGGKSRY
jgi:hypothetical protein